MLLNKHLAHHSLDRKLSLADLFRFGAEGTQQNSFLSLTLSFFVNKWA